MVSYCFGIKCKLLQMAYEALLDQICLLPSAQLPLPTSLLHAHPLRVAAHPNQKIYFAL